MILGLVLVLRLMRWRERDRGSWLGKWMGNRAGWRSLRSSGRCHCIAMERNEMHGMARSSPEEAEIVMLPVVSSQPAAHLVACMYSMRYPTIKSRGNGMNVPWAFWPPGFESAVFLFSSEEGREGRKERRHLSFCVMSAFKKTRPCFLSFHHMPRIKTQSNLHPRSRLR